MCHPGQTLIAVALIRFSTLCVSMYTVAWVMVLSTAVCKRSRVKEIQNKGWEKVCDFVSKKYGIGCHSDIISKSVNLDVLLMFCFIFQKKCLQSLVVNLVSKCETFNWWQEVAPDLFRTDHFDASNTWKSTRHLKGNLQLCSEIWGRWEE